MGEATASSRYPIGIQTFEKIRKGGYLYVDKTTFVYELAHGSGSTYFLNRPAASASRFCSPPCRHISKAGASFSMGSPYRSLKLPGNPTRSFASTSPP